MIDIPHQGSSYFYQLFFLFSYLVSFLLIIFHLLRDRHLNTRYIVAVTTVFVAFMIGTKLLPNLDKILELSAFPHPGAQMATGGVILLIPTLVLLRRLFNLDRAVYKYFALALLLGVAIQKPGCLLAGCCLGRYNADLLTVSYAGNYFYSALPVYEMLAYLIVFALTLFLLWKKQISNTQSFWIIILGYALIQLIAEFGRSDLQTVAFANELMGIKVLQLIYIILILVALGNIFLVRYWTISLKTKTLNEVPVIIGLVIAYWFVHKLLYQVEVRALYFILIPLIGVAIYKIWSVARRRYLVILSIAPILMMSQTVKNEPQPVNYAKYYNSYDGNPGEFNYFMIGGGYKAGNAINRVTHDPNPDDCWGPSYSNEFEHQFWLTGLNFTYVQSRLGINNRRYFMNFGANLTFGEHQERSLVQSRYMRTQTTFDINPFWSIDSKWVGFSLGGHIGNVSHLVIRNYRQSSSLPETGTNWANVTPQLSLRVGPQRWFYGEYNLGRGFMVTYPELPQYFVFGSQFSSQNGFDFRWGISLVDDNMFFASTIPIKQHYIIEPMFRFSEQNSVMLNFYYRFNKQEPSNIKKD